LVLLKSYATKALNYLISSAWKFIRNKNNSKLDIYKLTYNK
jgi:hypothetical protein